MKIRLAVPLDLSNEQLQRLLALQAAFAEVCSALAPQVQAARCWNRVALHHMAYKNLRERFPSMGSQMVCNAIYSVSRSARMLFQHPKSPFNLSKLGTAPLPLLRFTENCPVYFDRHTLSVKEGQLSMYTLDGRMRFKLGLSAQDEANFHRLKLLEVLLSRDEDNKFSLSFWFDDGLGEEVNEKAAASSVNMVEGAYESPGDLLEIPEYLIVQEAA